MQRHDFDNFAQLLDDAMELKPTWRPLSAKAKALYFKALEQYPFEVVSRAMTAHIRDPQRGQFQPAPADLVAQINGFIGNDGRPGAEEAWATALTSQDESETIVWTRETAEAFSITRPVLASSGAISARKTFVEAYERLVNQARFKGEPVAWSASLGWDEAKRERVVQKARECGLLPAPYAQALLPNHSTLSGTEGQESPEGLKRLKEEVAKLRDAWAANAERRAKKLEEERKAVAQKKAEIARRVAEVQQQGQA